MSLRKFVLKHAPKSFLPFLRISYHAYKEYRSRKNQPLTQSQINEYVQTVQENAMKYLPYYQDDLSREILSDCLEFQRTGDRNIFLSRMEKIGMKFHGFFYAVGREASGIVILYDHEGEDLINTKRALALLEWAGTCREMTFQDFFDGAKIFDTELILPVLSKSGSMKFALRLITRNIKADVFNGLFYLINEELQYFDVFSPVDDEIVVDAGAYDGATAIRFLKWGQGKVKRVYSFEFDPDNADECEKNLKPYADKVTLVKKGTWDKDEIMHMTISGSASRVDSKGSTAVQLTSIDSVVQDEHVTFIKMDVEGAELKSLIGAKNTIINNHPRLAICAYHKGSDLYELPEYILSIVPEYKFYLRHYSTCAYETVLYAYCD